MVAIRKLACGGAAGAARVGRAALRLEDLPRAPYGRLQVAAADFVGSLSEVALTVIAPDPYTGIVCDSPALTAASALRSSPPVTDSR